MTGWYNSSSTEQPQKIDATSSEIYVYIHKEVRKKEVENVNGGTTTVYDYLEKKMTKDEFIAYSDLIQTDERTEELEAGMIGLEEAMCDNYAEQAETNATVEEALIEIYELIEGGN